MQLIHKLKPFRIPLVATLVLYWLPIVSEKEMPCPHSGSWLKFSIFSIECVWIYWKKHIWKSIPRSTAEASEINVFKLRHTKKARAAHVRFITNGCLFEITVGGSPIEIGTPKKLRPKRRSAQICTFSAKYNIITIMKCDTIWSGLSVAVTFSYMLGMEYIISFILLRSIFGSLCCLLLCSIMRLYSSPLNYG